jgi:hypothetical protein
MTCYIAVVVGRVYTGGRFVGSPRFRRVACQLVSIEHRNPADVGGLPSSGPSLRFPSGLEGQQLAVPPKHRKNLTPKGWPVLTSPMRALNPRPESIKRKTSQSPRRNCASRMCRGGASLLISSLAGPFLFAIFSGRPGNFMEAGL